MKRFLKSLFAIMLVFAVAISANACGNSKSDKESDAESKTSFPSAEVAVANLQKLNYSVDADCDNENLEQIYGVTISMCVMADKGDECIYIYYTASATDAKSLLNVFEEENWVDFQEQCSEDALKAVKGTAGSVFYFGTENALKVAKTGKAPATSDSTPQVSGTVNIDNVKSKLEKAGYTVVLVEGDEAKEYDEGVTAILTAIKGTDFKNTITIVWYDNADDAKKAEEEAKEELKKMGDEADNYVVKRSGKCVWMGSKEAVNIANLK